MNLLIWVCLALVTPSAFALYFTGDRDVFVPPTKANRNNSYFGYSITYDEVYKKLVVSAPRMSDIGEVYDCNIENQVCAQISRDTIRRDVGKDGANNYTHDFWFGATVKAGRDYVLMCAPRYTEYFKRFGAYVTQGRCYSHEKGHLTERRIISEAERLANSQSPMETTMDSFGWSVDVADDDTVIVGGPGMFHGRAMIYDQPGVIPKLMSDRNIPKFNFGYAVASGTFVNDYLSYAVGSPYGSGEVSFYKRVKYLRKLDKAVDTGLIGSMFGSVLCAAKLFGERTDLLVGAPIYAAKNTYNQGAVYVYLARTLKQAPQFHRRIVGQTSGSMFGSAIVNVGDLNGDRKDEIAIGAPFEKDGRGVVYVYSGADLISKLAERDFKYLQKIEPESIYGESFGMSLTPLLDYDENGCKELAIGSPYKDTVVLFRCMAAAVVETSAKFPNVQGRTSTGKTYFEFDVCLAVTYPRQLKTVTARILTTVEMYHESAKLVGTDGSGRISFKTDLGDKKSEYCKKVPFILPATGKYETEIRYTISSELEVDPRNLKDFQSSRVILSDRSVLTIQDSLWAAECAGNKICVPKLELTHLIGFHDDVHPYIIGSSTKETINIMMHNDGEVAYDSCVRVQIDGAHVLKPGGCVYESSIDGNSLKCEPPMPLLNKKSWTTDEIELEMTHLTNLDNNITISMVLYNRCNGIKEITQNETIQIPLRADPGGITVKGETDIGSIIKMTEEDIKKNGKMITHVYTISNSGPTNWVGLSVRVLLQMQPFIYYENVNNASVTVAFSQSSAPCQVESQDATSMTYVCLVENLKAKKESAKILIPMYILPGTLEGLLDQDKNVTIVSEVKLELTEYNPRVHLLRVYSIITLQAAPVPFQTIIIAVIVGLCILIIIALILYRIGFLQRKRREELQKLRKSVRRQTVLRRSTMPSQTPQAEDRRQILEGMKEEDEHDHPPNLI